MTCVYTLCIYIYAAPWSQNQWYPTINSSCVFRGPGTAQSMIGDCGLESAYLWLHVHCRADAAGAVAANGLARFYALYRHEKFFFFHDLLTLKLFNFACIITLLYDSSLIVQLVSAMWRFMNVSNPKECNRKDTEKKATEQQYEQNKQRRIYRTEWERDSTTCRDQGGSTTYSLMVPITSDQSENHQLASGC